MSTVIISPFGIFDSLVKNTYEHGDKISLNGVQVFQRELTLIKLTIQKNAFNDVLHMIFYPLGRGVIEGPGSRLHCIGEHEYACFLCLGLWSRIAEILLFCW